jgi:predicted enzyme related to lactoylglutathione lyase
MKTTFSILIAFGVVLFAQILTSCSETPKISTTLLAPDTMENLPNPVVYFEIPVTDIERATQFYKAIFNFSFDKEKIDNNEMALFPFHEKATGISGALAKGEIYKPTVEGVLIYFNTANIDETLKRATQHGAKVLYPKTDNGIGFVAEFQDSEGNRIALFQVYN